MLAAFFQTRLLNRQSVDRGRPGLGVLFVDFFNFFTEYKMKEIDIKPFSWEKSVDVLPVSFKTRDLINLQITDPLNPTNNVAKSSFNFMQLENLFRFIYFSFFQPNQESLLENVFESSKLFYYLTQPHKKGI